MDKSKFITFEGIEGVGKTTQLQYVAKHLTYLGYSVLITREPGGTQIGEEIRDILLAHRHEPVSDLTELLLMFAARAQHIERIIKPALESGKIVLCDRFTDASFAYQGGGRGIPEAKIAELEELVQGKLRPDITFLLDAPPEVGLTRAKHRNHADRFENEEIDFFNRVRKAYLERAKQFPKRFIVIDAAQSTEAVHLALNEQLQIKFLTLEET